MQIRIKSFDLAVKKARIAVRVAARRPFGGVVGPGQVFGGVASDGGGIRIINGKVVPIPPRSPVFALAEQMASLVATEASVAALSAGLGLARAVQAGGRRG